MDYSSLMIFMERRSSIVNDLYHPSPHRFNRMFHDCRNGVVSKEEELLHRNGYGQGYLPDALTRK